MTPLLIALLVFALSAIVAYAYRHAPVIHDAVTVETVREDAMEYDNE